MLKNLCILHEQVYVMQNSRSSLACRKGGHPDLTTGLGGVFLHKAQLQCPILLAVSHCK